MNRQLLLLWPVVVFAHANPPLDSVPSTDKPAPKVEEIMSVPESGRFQEFFRPFRTDTAALSPDGKYVAFSLREGSDLSVVVIETEHPAKATAKVKVATDQSATEILAASQGESTPARIRWLRWVSPTRVAVETNRITAWSSGSDHWSHSFGAIYALDANGTNVRLVVEPADLPRPVTIDDELNSKFTNFRPPLAQKITGTWQANQAVDEVESSDGAPTWAPGSSVPASPVDPTLPSDTSKELAGGYSPQLIQAFDLDPAAPGSLLVMASGGPDKDASRRIDLFSVDTVSGKATRRLADFVLRTRVSLPDRQGHIRLTLPNSFLSDFPFQYAYRGPKGAGRDRPLADFLKFGDFSVSPGNFFGPRSIPIGFDENPEVLFYADNKGRDTYGLYSVNLTTGERGRVTIENPNYDLVEAPTSGFSLARRLVFDRHDRQFAGIRFAGAMRTTAWVRPELNGLQSFLEKSFPGRSVEIMDWDRDRRRFLVATEGPADAGAFYLVDSEARTATEFARRAPWIDAAHTHPTLPFHLTTSGGQPLSGLVTVPRKPHLKPIPMIILCPTWPWERVNSDFSTEVQALADMGFVVVQLNSRGTWGLGLQHRQAITAGYDNVQVADIAGAIAPLEKTFAINPNRVALLGFGHGGFIALRTLQEHPDKFRCAVALDAPVDLAQWLDLQKWRGEDVQPLLMKAWLGDEARLKAAPLAQHPELIRKPALILNYPGPEGGEQTPTYLAALRLAKAIEKRGGTVQFGRLSTDYMRGLPGARARVFGQIEEFLNLNVYDFKVKLPEMKTLGTSNP